MWPLRRCSPEQTSRDSDQTLLAQLRREAPRIIEVLEDERGEVHEVLVRVVEPRAGRQRENGGVALDIHTQETDRACSEEASPGVRQLPVDRVEDRTEQNTIL